ncbi:unnamed protein product [Caenorhabditis bovis]|uniref:U4/U6.U5 tri-snRNP-associated protein 1 n=1 Tax=Caenorhabditis bovis TaxID=2654633 RepID=A0A8S1EI47_9PELO|nr:unnamed protein product [Caenorhabditis bovis]
MSSKYSKKRKQDDGDTSMLHHESRRRRSSSSSSTESPRQTKKAVKPKKEDEDNGEPADSMSIEETNKLRASLGLAPLQVEENKERDADDGTGEKIYNEDGFEFRHRKAENWAEKKRENELKEKLEVAKKKRDIYSKVLRTKGLAESDEDDSAESWIEKMRKKEEERKAAERAKMFDELDEEIEESKKPEKPKKKLKKGTKADSSTAGLVVGHSKDAFMEGDQILVLDDKGVLDDGDEVLVNPNLLENERHVRNVELRKRKDHYRNYDEEVDEFGNKKNFGVLAKYDEELEGVPKEQFRLDETGGIDLDEERREREMFKKLQMAGKRLETLDAPKYKLATEFYTQDEMVAFRKVKKGKKEKNTRKRKILKASDLVPVEAAGEGRRDMGKRRRHDGDEDDEEKSRNDDEDMAIKKEKEEYDDDEDDGKWKKSMDGNGVDLERLRKLKEAASAPSDDESDDDFMPVGGVDLTGVVIKDDAEDELYSALAQARRLKEFEKKKETEDRDIGKRVRSILSSHEAQMEEQESAKKSKKSKIVLDSTIEYCRQIGEPETLDGNMLAKKRDAARKKMTELTDDIEQDETERREEEIKELEIRNQEKGRWLAAGEPATAELDSDDEKALEEAKNKKWSDNEEDSDSDYEPALGREVDVSKGVGAMLKLAAQKGYLQNKGDRGPSGPSLEHLKNRSKTQIDAGRHSNDIEDKYMKKLDRLGTTGKGPLVPFVEKADYHPEVNITYVDKKGRDMDAKDAYRELSYKFHGRNPGKKQLEKRANRKDKEERMMKTNSYDTPLGTLSKQLKKQKQLATPYLVLSGSSDHSSSLKKE